MSIVADSLRKQMIKELFTLNSFKNPFPIWKNTILDKVSNWNDPVQVQDIGDSLHDIFKETGTAGRTQSTLTQAGTAWECLVCWYMNLCLIGSRAVVLRPTKKRIPEPITRATSVYYNNTKSNSETDLLCIIFPNLDVFSEIHKAETLNSLVSQYFNQFEVGIIQCKTNWNDIAQIPMLWDMVYSSEGWSRNIVVGDSAFSIKGLKNFFYAFVTVPSKNMKYTSTSINTARVRNISGGNYWGRPTKQSVAFSIKEIFGRNFRNAFEATQRETLGEYLPMLDSEYSYFNLKYETR